MAYTLKQLTMAYTAVHGGIAPTGTVLEDLQNRAAQNAAGAMTDAQVLGYVLNSADNSTALAALSYQFFTGKSPTKEGLAFLVNSADNADDLNDAYYAQFNTENRYINFAANLGVHGEGAETFAAKYGALSFADYIASIYETIVGTAYAKAAGIDQAAAIAYLVASQDALLATAKSSGMITPGMTQAQIDLALKAAAAGFLLGEAIKADVGVYAGAANNFMLAVATDKAVYNTDITATYTPTVEQGAGQPVTTAPSVETTPGYEPPPPPPPPPSPPAPTNRNFTMTVGNDTFTGGAGDDTFTGTDLTYSDNDVLNGGAGHDTLTITATPGAGSVYALPNDGATSIETVNITSDGGVNGYSGNYTGLTELNINAGRGATNLTVLATTDVDLTVTGQASEIARVYGGKDITVTSTGATTGEIRIGSSSSSTKPTGDVVISRELVNQNNAGDITVYGGKTVSITQTAVTDPYAPQTNGAVYVYGSALTTEVTVKADAALHSGPQDRDANTVEISDAVAGLDVAGSISKVSVDGYTTLNFAGTALSDLSLANGSGSVFLDNSGLTTGNVTTLNLKVDGVTGGAVRDIGVYTTLNLATGATNSTLANIAFSAARTLNVSGDSQVILNSTAGLSALETVTISGAAALAADLSGATVTSVSSASGTGNNFITLDASKATFTGGAGVDRITTTATNITHAISLGDGNDRLIMTSATGLSATIDGGGGTDGLEMTTALAATLSGQSPTILNFETLQLSSSTNQSINLAGLGDFTIVTIGGGAVATLTGLTGAALTTVTTSGGAGLSGDFSSANATSVNTSGSSGAATLTLKGSQTAFTGGSGADTITMTAAAVSKAIDLGGGDDKLVLTSATGVTAALNGGSGTDTLVMTASLAATLAGQTNAITNFEALELSGASGQTISLNGIGAFTSVKATGAALTLTSNSATLGSLDASALTGAFTWTATHNEAATLTVKGSATAANVVDLTAMEGAVTYTGGGDADTVKVAGGAHVITLGSGFDKVTITNASGDASTADYVTISDLSNGDKIVFGNGTMGGSQIGLGQEILTGSTFADKLNAAAAGNGGAMPVATWFQSGGNTYLVVDNSASGTFQTGVDYIVKLTGSVPMESAYFVNGTLTFYPAS